MFDLLPSFCTGPQSAPESEVLVGGIPPAGQRGRPIILARTHTHTHRTRLRQNGSELKFVIELCQEKLCSFGG